MHEGNTEDIQTTFVPDKSKFYSIISYETELNSKAKYFRSVKSNISLIFSTLSDCSLTYNSKHLISLVIIILSIKHV